MSLRTLIPVGGLLLLVLARTPGDPHATTVCPLPFSPLSEAKRLATEHENGCLDPDAASKEGWPPEWDSATIADGEDEGE